MPWLNIRQRRTFPFWRRRTVYGLLGIAWLTFMYAANAQQQLGFVGVMIPRECGGLRLGHVARTIILKQIGRIPGAKANILQITHLEIAKKTSTS